MSNLVLAAGLALLGVSDFDSGACRSPGCCSASAWALGLYDAAFAALGRIYGDAARALDHRHHADRGLCLHRRMAADRLGLETIGWRDTCFAWAAAHILIGLPLNLFMLPAVKGAKAAVAAAVKPHIPIDRTMMLLAFIFAAAWTRHRRDGGAYAAHSGSRRRDHRAGGVRRRADRPGASGGPHLRSEFSQPLSIRWSRPGWPA